MVIAIGWLISVWVELTVVAIVGEDLDVMAGVRRAWEVISHNWGPVILVTLIIFIGTGILNLLIGVPFVLVVAPILISMGMQGQAVFTNSMIIAGVLFLLYLPVAIFLSGLVQTYATTVWTLLFRRLTGRTGEVLTVPGRPLEPIETVPAAEEPGGHVDIIEPVPPSEQSSTSASVIEPDNTD